MGLPAKQGQSWSAVGGREELRGRERGRWKERRPDHRAQTVLILPADLRWRHERKWEKGKGRGEEKKGNHSFIPLILNRHYPRLWAYGCDYRAP